MEKIITFDKIRSYTYVNDNVVTKPIKGIAINFFGLGCMHMCNDVDSVEGQFYGKDGILYVVPYNNPWGWMNKQEVDYTDEIIDVIFDHFNLEENTPIVSTGGSMGGQCAITYMAYAKRTPVACVANCPVCDVVYHYTERVDLPRTLYSALYGTNGTLEEGLKSLSPVHLIEKLPRAEYHIFHCNTDDAVNMEKHSVPFVEKMKMQGFDITFDIVENRGHCDLDYDSKLKYASYIKGAILK